MAGRVHQVDGRRAAGARRRPGRGRLVFGQRRDGARGRGRGRARPVPQAQEQGGLAGTTGTRDEDEAAAGRAGGAAPGRADGRAPAAAEDCGRAGGGSVSADRVSSRPPAPTDPDHRAHREAASPASAYARPCAWTWSTLLRSQNPLLSYLPAPGGGSRRPHRPRPGAPLETRPVPPEGAAPTPPRPAGEGRQTGHPASRLTTCSPAPPGR